MILQRPAAFQSVCWQKRIIQTTAPVAASERVALPASGACSTPRWDRRSHARLAIRANSAQPERLAELLAEPLVPDLARPQPQVVAVLQEPEHGVDQPHEHQETRPPLPARLVPAAPEEIRPDRLPQTMGASIQCHQGIWREPDDRRPAAEERGSVEQRAEAGEDQGKGEDRRSPTGKADRSAAVCSRSRSMGDSNSIDGAAVDTPRRCGTSTTRRPLLRRGGHVPPSVSHPLPVAGPRSAHARMTRAIVPQGDPCGRGVRSDAEGRPRGPGRSVRAGAGQRRSRARRSRKGGGRPRSFEPHGRPGRRPPPGGGPGPRVGVDRRASGTGRTRRTRRPVPEAGRSAASPGGRRRPPRSTQTQPPGAGSDARAWSSVTARTRSVAPRPEPSRLAGPRPAGGNPLGSGLVTMRPELSIVEAILVSIVEFSRGHPVFHGHRILGRGGPSCTAARTAT